MTCYCAHVTELPTRTRVVVLQHPRERGNAIGTAHMAKLCLPAADIVVGVDFSTHRRARSLLADPHAPAVLLYPATDARDLRTDPPQGPVTLVVLDGTWSHAKTLLKRNPWLRSLPRIAFQPERPSEYRIRREPQESYVSTIEALAAALGLLEGDPARFQAMLVPFRAMIDAQLRFVESKPQPRRRRVPRRRADPASRLDPLLLEPRLLCATVEANAWAFDRALGTTPYPHEIVQCCATHLGDASVFEQVLAPRSPLAESPLKHSRLRREDLLAGTDLDRLRATWSPLVHEDDVLCVWGSYALNLMRREGLSLPRRIVDVGRLAAIYLRTGTSRPEDLTAKLDLPWQSLGRGRGGDRLGMLVAVTRWLSDRARDARPGSPASPPSRSSAAPHLPSRERDGT